MQAIARRLGLGKFRYYKGSDLQGNNYFEFENAMAKETTAYKSTRRTVEYKQNKPLHEYMGSDLAPSWIAWLRHTKQDPPSMQEQLAEQQRVINLRANVAKIDEAYQSEQTRMQTQRKTAIADVTRPSIEAPSASEGLKTTATPVKGSQAKTPEVSDLRQRAREEMMRKKKEMTKSPLEAFRPATAPDANYQPEAWQPTRRR